jgi:acetolactate synthase-1/3 small subunit
MRQTYTITAFSENHIGLLNRITIIFTRRRVNIETLTVSPSAIKGVHKFTITVNETREMVEKVVKQIDKVVDVIKAFYHTDDEIIFQEIALYKVSTDILLNSNKVENLVRKSAARIVEVTPTYTVIEKMGTAAETQELFEELNKIGILQFTRSGRIAVTRLSEELLHNFLRERNLSW